MIIGEIGINHEGSELTARAMLKNLMETSIDAITFQIPAYEYLNGSEPKRIPLSKEFYKEAIKETHRNNKKIGFACGDSTLINFLDTAGSDFWKTFSWDIINKNLHRELQKTLKKTYVSTGVSSIQEIIMIDGTLNNISFIHTQISNEITDVNLKAINTMKSKLKNNIAFGLHCSELEVLYLSLTFEPSDLFFYVKNSVNNNFPDGPHAIPIADLQFILDKIYKFKKALGDGEKKSMDRKWE